MSEITDLLRKWAGVLTIPSGDFVNEDLIRAADHIDALEARVAELSSELEISDAEGNHAFALAVDDPGKNPPRLWRDYAQSLEAKLAVAEKALEPFASHDWTDEIGWSDLACQNDRVCDWFGPSDFRTARQAISTIREGRE